MIWNVDVYTDVKYNWMDDYNPKLKTNQYGKYYVIEVPNNKKRKVLRKLNNFKLKNKWYDSRFSRSSNYRYNFFKLNSPPYRCRYCHKKITNEELEVDHLIPIAKAKDSVFVRNLLYIHGIDNVNDPKNLVASCKKCNRRKGSKMGFWYIRGVLGKYKIYWILLYTLKFFVIVGILYLFYMYVPSINHSINKLIEEYI